MIARATDKVAALCSLSNSPDRLRRRWKLGGDGRLLTRRPNAAQNLSKGLKGREEVKMPLPSPIPLPDLLLREDAEQVDQQPSLFWRIGVDEAVGSWNNRQIRSDRTVISI